MKTLDLEVKETKNSARIARTSVTCRKIKEKPKDSISGSQLSTSRMSQIGKPLAAYGSQRPLVQKESNLSQQSFLR